jgi:uncharacterized repeat protein (TIGR01451 family)
MTRLTRLFGAILLALATTFAAPAPVRAGGVDALAAPRTISNVAEIEWDVGGEHLRQASNRVDIALDAAPSAFSLTAYRFDSGAGSTAIAMSTPQCQGLSGTVPVELAPAWQSGSLQTVQAAPVQKVRAGEPLLIAFDYARGNLDPARIDTITAIVLTQSGDRETLTLAETAPDSGKFAGYIQTVSVPPDFVAGDCRLSVHAGDTILVECLKSGTQIPLVQVELGVLVDPFGIVFDSLDGHPVDGARVTLVDDSSGQPAQVFGEDGASAYPSAVVSGSRVVDGGGNSYDLPAGSFRFPVVRPGRYRLLVEPPAGYAAPSRRSAADMAALRQPDGTAFEIVAASFGGAFVLTGPKPVEVGIPVDPAGEPIQLVKRASVAEAAPGDAIVYTVDVRNPDARLATGPLTLRDRFPASLRLRAGTVRVDGRQAQALTAKADGFELALSPLAAGATAHVQYALEVRGDAGEGDALNRATASDDRGAASNVADAAVRIRRDPISGRMTIAGRVLDGACGAAAPRGIGGVRIMLEDGSYAVTDSDGRYHFEGIVPGTHVVQLDDMTLPADRIAIDCASDSRSGGRAHSRFVEGQGGLLKRVDFHAIASAPRAQAGAAAARPAIPTDAAAAGADRDWLAGQEPGIAWLFPEADYNPRAPIARVAIRHAPGQSVKLLSGGKPVDAIAFDGTRRNEAGNVAVSLWRGVPLEEGATELSAEIRNADGSLAETLHRTVRYGAGPMRAELLRDRSVLVADGVHRPVLAVRLTDRDGRPIRHGSVGDFEVPAPYYPAVEADAQQARQLAGLERARPFWRVQGDDGIAYVELEPTTASGSLSLRFNFREGRTVREQRLEAWLDPGERPWTIVGLAEGTIGYNRLDARMETLAATRDKVLTDGRLALYAKGRVLGRWLMTLSYDSDKKQDQTRFGGVIDPQLYYTVYADRSERRYDASSVRKLYLKLERPQFYALFGDYETGIDEPQLARYVRALNGAKAEYRSARVSATAFASDTPSRHRRDEIQGNGLSGPYALGARNLLANSERIAIEVRDRLRSDRIVDSRLLMRNIDYDIDYAAGTVRFREPVLSRTSGLDPQFIVADYEVDGVANRTLNAGGRASWRSKDQKLQVGATAIRDSDERRRTDLAGADIRYRPSESTEIRAEIAVSDSRAKAGAAAPAAGTAAAWLVEAEHHGPHYDLLAYVREQETGFGLGQTNLGEAGTRKIGFDGRVALTDTLSLSGSGWIEDYLASDARRIAGRGLLEYRGRTLSGRAGLTFADDRLADGRTARSTLLQLGATKRLLGNKLELDAQTEIPLGQAESVDFPARHHLSARYAFSSAVQLVATYEIADGKNVDARTARIGFDLAPWAGARIAVSGNFQNIAEYGPRSFAAFGLSQSLVLDKHWSVDVTLDSNKTLGGIDPARVLNPLHPVASGGFVGSGGITEDFTAATAGATYRAGAWSLTGRAEYRDGEQENRWGFTAAGLRQIGEGSAAGGALNWFTARTSAGQETRTANLQLSWAHRPAGSAWSWLEKLEIRDDSVKGAVAGLPGPLGTPLTVTGDARSRRAVSSLSIDFAPGDRQEIALFWGSRYVSDRIDGDDVAGWSNVVGADIRFDLSDMVDIGLAATLREGLGARSFAYAAGPSLGIRPFENGWLSIGWNLVGFHDRDFEDARYTRSGPYVTMRFKFDQLSLQGLGLGRR